MRFDSTWREARLVTESTHAHGAAGEVEFVTLTGKTAAVVTVPAAQVRPVGSREIPHARALANGPTSRSSQ